MPNWKLFKILAATAIGLSFLSAGNIHAEPSTVAVLESASDKNNKEQPKIEIPEGYYNPTNQSAKQKILGIERERWEKDLPEAVKRPFERNFLDNLLAYEKALKQKRSADQFHKLDGEYPKNHDNPFHVYGRKKRTKYIVDLSLSKTDYAKLILFLPEMQEMMIDEHVERYLPYIALCAAEGMKFSDIRFYVRRDAFMESPIDIALDRLYRELKMELREI